jgi:CheY-like chemotaxis protein
MTKKIAWIEDDANIIRSVVKPLEYTHKIEIEIFDSMKHALDEIDAIKECDLILLDVILPSGMKEMEGQFHIGVHLLRKLRELGVQIPVIAFTVIGNSETAKQLRELGVVKILNKPIFPSELEHEVMSVLSR